MKVNALIERLQKEANESYISLQKYINKHVNNMKGLIDFINEMAMSASSGSIQSIIENDYNLERLEKLNDYDEFEYHLDDEFGTYEVFFKAQDYIYDNDIMNQWLNDFKNIYFFDLKPKSGREDDWLYNKIKKNCSKKYGNINDLDTGFMYILESKNECILGQLTDMDPEHLIFATNNELK